MPITSDSGLAKVPAPHFLFVSFPKMKVPIVEALVSEVSYNRSPGRVRSIGGVQLFPTFIYCEH